MSDVTTPAATGTPAVATPPAATAAPAAAPVAASAPAATDQTPAWLPDRLEQAKKAALAEIGITDPAKAKAIIAAAAKAEEDAKTAAQKLGETSTKLTAIEAELARQKTATAAFATQALATLTDAQKAQVASAIAAAGGNPEDPALQLSMTAALRPGWGTPVVAASAATAAPAVATPTTPAAGTAPPRDAPNGTQVSPPDHAAIYAQLEKTNPFRAAEYAAQHPEIYK